MHESRLRSMEPQSGRNRVWMNPVHLRAHHSLRSAHALRKIGIDQLEAVEAHAVRLARGVAELDQDRPPQFCG